jgi:uncharacterized protein
MKMELLVRMLITMSKSKLTKKQKEIISEVHDYVKKESEGFSDIDDVFENHVMGVVKFSEQLADKYESNKFVVILAAYLHDIIHLQTKNHKTHEIEGSKFVLDYLKKFNIPNEEINLVSLCILNHRGSKKNERKSVEEKIVSCADAIDHIDRCVEMFFRWAIYEKNYEKAMEFIRGKLKRSWKKLELPEAKELVRNKYEAAKILFGF